jgi:hypothetical protein
MGRAGDKKQSVPKMDDKPIQGLVSDKNFIVANAVENILAGKTIQVKVQKSVSSYLDFQIYLIST